jgi:two-component sensor histidine kinase
LKITNIVEELSITDKMKSKVKLANIFGLISCAVFLTTGINNYLLGDPQSAIFLELLAMFSLLTLAVNFYFNPKTAFLYLFIFITAGVFFFDSYSGVDSGSYLYYFPLSLAVANMFDFQTKNDRIILISQLLLIGILIFLNIVTDHKIFENENLTIEQKNEMFNINMLISVICLVYFIFLIVSSNVQKLSLLENLVNEESKLRNLEVEKNREKEILLAELQHRLKNNLSLMSSLLKLKLENVNDDNYSFAYKESIHAIHTVAQANHLQKFEEGRLIIPTEKYLKEVKLYWFQLFEELPIAGKININSETFFLNVKQAIPIGLIIHEIISVFWIQSIMNDLNKELIINVVKRKDKIQINVHSTILNLTKLDLKKEVIIHALIEQIDAVANVISAEDFNIEIQDNISAPLLESEALFKK